MDPSEIEGVAEEAPSLIIFIIPLLVILGAWLINVLVRRSQNRYLAEQEQHFRGKIRLTNLRHYPEGKCRDAALVTGSAAIANNYFVSFWAGLKHVFGGEMKGYTSLCTVAHRLCLVRLMQEAEAMGANAIYNVRFETASILSANNRKQMGGVELIAYGTAVKETETV